MLDFEHEEVSGFLGVRRLGNSVNSWIDFFIGFNRPGFGGGWFV
jgi:hypothetical protein